MLWPFVSSPWLALIPAVVFALLRAWHRGSHSLSAAVAWAAYGAYEYGMHERWLCSGECNIRVDLLLAGPILVVLTLGAAVSAARRDTRSVTPVAT